MKRIIPHLPNITASASVLFASLALFASASLLSGCSESELPGDDDNLDTNLTALTIKVSDGGYAAAAGEQPATREKSATRATENGYTTRFTAGDKIGVFAVKNGTIVDGVNNLCLVATATTASGGSTSLVWKTEAGKTPLNISGAAYYAYYPWQSDTYMANKVTASANNTATFFARVISNWTPPTNQGTYAAYTSFDLMIATATAAAADRNLSFSMQHQMALVVIDLPKTKYTLTDASGNSLPEYILDAPDTKFNAFTPCRMDDGTYRYLINPAATAPQPTTLSGSYTNATSATAEWQFTASVPAGQYKKYAVDNATVIAKSHQLQVGDFFMKDGTLLSKEKSLSNEEKSDCIGIVYWVGSEALNEDPLLATDHPDCTHGLVVALQDAGGDMHWSDEYETITTNWINKESNPYKDKVDLEKDNVRCGYSNTLALIDYNAGKYSSAVGSSNGYRVLPIDAIQQYADAHPAPTNSSGWYFPSIMELKYVCWGQGNGRGTNGKENLNTNISKVGGTLFGSDYWPSTEDDSYGSDIAWSVHFKDGFLSGRNKRQYTFRVRPLLAF